MFGSLDTTAGCLFRRRPYGKAMLASTVSQADGVITKSIFFLVIFFLSFFPKGF